MYYLRARFSGYGKCSNCNEYNTFPVWCQTCDPKETTQGWTSGDKALYDFIKNHQLETIAYDEVIEWIPFDKLKNMKLIGEGGFSTVFSAIWLDGVRKVEYEDGKYKRTRETSCKVAVKTLSSEDGSSDSLVEFKNHIECRMKGTGLEVYGLTRYDNKYMMVFQYANEGNLHQCLQSNFKRLHGKINYNC
ncbi:hypothetical protein C2G38_746391 [Gigaspora rosea]|uniref:Protein kinase domain-containing protein n=1 Tax=Gigaspora rosea TaxID=44941 RepID=A0A397U0N7_9GLOM|nr:hypothetical protein C2G38_746391 [Gigaspora rosea]